MGTSKKTVSYSIKGFLDNQNGIITEVTKDDEIPVNLNAILDEFDGQEISITIGQKSELEGDD